MDKVSVVIPTYNRQTTLMRAIKSVQQQTYAVYEILICDDGSTDDSFELVKNLKDEKIKWLPCGKNGMPSIPRNIGINNATGNWIAFLDSDDEWLPKKIELQLNEMKKVNAQASSTNAYRIHGGKNCGVYSGYSKKDISFLDLLPVNHIICSSSMVKTEMLKKISLFPEAKAFKAIEDYALWLRLSSQINFVFLNQPLINYFDEPQVSIRSNYTDVWALREIVFTDLSNWLIERKISLTNENESAFKKTIKEINNKGKVSLLERVKNKLKS